MLLDVLLENALGEAERIADETRHLGELRARSPALTLRALVDVTCERHLRLLALHGDIYRRHHRHIDFDRLVRASVARYVEVDSLEDWMRELAQLHYPAREPAPDSFHILCTGPVKSTFEILSYLITV